MKHVMLGFAFAVAALHPAWADRSPTPAERLHIEAVLRSAGFLRWDGIELEDGRWEVDDAVALDGRTFDLRLDPSTLAILQMERD